MTGEKNKGGRPKKEISKKQFEELCKIQCTQAEICGVLDVTDKTLTKWVKEAYNESYSEVYKKKSKNGLTSLRRYQFKLAEHNTSMAIWLGKQWLGQKDIIETTHDISKLPTISLNVVDNSELEKELYKNKTTK